MGVALEIVNHDDLFRMNSRTPVIINDFCETSEDEKNDFNRLIYTKYKADDLLNNLPTCECGEVTGGYNVGVLCRNCHTEVSEQMEHNLEPLVWLRAPKGVSALINPVIWTMINTKFKRSGFEIIRWLCDQTYTPSVKIPAVMEQIIELRIPRGYNNFVDNFDMIMEKLFDLSTFRAKKGTVDPLYALIKQYRRDIFSQYMPLPNRSLLVLEESNVGTYADPFNAGAVDAIWMMVGIDTPTSTHTARVRENRTVKCIAQLGEYYDKLYRRNISPKEGVARKHLYGTRMHFCFRNVISSLTDAHDYDELHLPWGTAVSLFRLHLVNKLFRRGYNPNNALAYLNKHATQFCPQLNEIFLELINECPYRGIPVVFQRNPSLERASAQAMYVTRIKTDPDDPTVSLSILSVVGYNADFDGDQLNGSLSLDHYTAEELRHLAPHKSVFGLDEPRVVTSNPSMPKPVVATIANWIHHPDAKIADPVKEERMKVLLA